MKNYFFFIDDNIWIFRDLATQKPASLFDNAYLGFLKKMHEQYNIKVQLNIFFATAPEHKGPYFDLTLMPDTYKDEWIANSDWLRLAFHSSREFPDYPYINASYEEMKYEYSRVKEQVIRFAGKETLSSQLVIHCLPVTHAATKALMECGVNALASTYGFDAPEGSEDKVNPRFIERLNENHFEDTSRIYVKNSSGGILQYALRGYNHIPQEEADKYEYTSKYYRELDIPVKRMAHVVLNSHSPEAIVNILTPMLDSEFIGIGNHEQYFYKDYRNYESDYCDRIEAAMKLLHDNGYTAIFMDELL